MALGDILRERLCNVCLRLYSLISRELAVATKAKTQLLHTLCRKNNV